MDVSTVDPYSFHHLEEQTMLMRSAESIWTSTIGPTSAKSPNATIFAASPTPAVFSGTSEKSTVSMVDPRLAACVRIRIANAVQVLDFPEKKT